MAISSVFNQGNPATEKVAYLGGLELAGALIVTSDVTVGTIEVTSDANVYDLTVTHEGVIENGLYVGTAPNAQMKMITDATNSYIETPVDLKITDIGHSTTYASLDVGTGVLAVDGLDSVLYGGDVATTHSLVGSSVVVPAMPTIQTTSTVGQFNFATLDNASGTTDVAILKININYAHNFQGYWMMTGRAAINTTIRIETYSDDSFTTPWNAIYYNGVGHAGAVASRDFTITGDATAVLVIRYWSNGPIGRVYAGFQ